MKGLGRLPRVAARLVAFATTTFALYAAHVVWVSWPAPWLSPRTAARRSSRLIRAWARSTARILRLELRVDGVPPTAPFLLVSNHLGYVDVVVLAMLLDCVFVAKSEVARWPFLGRPVRACGTIFVDRNRLRDVPRALALLERTLATGRGVVVFPEGTSSGGGTVLPFRSSFLAAATRAGLAVRWAALAYDTGDPDAPARASVCWWGDMRFVRHLLDLFALPGFTALVSFGGEPIALPDRKHLAATLRDTIADRLSVVAAGGTPGMRRP